MCNKRPNDTGAFYTIWWKKTIQIDKFKVQEIEMFSDMRCMVVSIFIISVHLGRGRCLCMVCDQKTMQAFQTGKLI